MSCGGKAIGDFAPVSCRILTYYVLQRYSPSSRVQQVVSRKHLHLGPSKQTHATRLSSKAVTNPDSTCYPQLDDNTDEMGANVSK